MTDTKADRPVNERAIEQLIALQQLAQADIIFFKDQQWKITNHALLLFAAIVGASKLTGSAMGNVGFLFLMTAALSVLFLAGFLIHQFGGAIFDGRDRLWYLRESFEPEALRAYGARKGIHAARELPEKKKTVDMTLIAVLIVSCAVTCWMLCVARYPDVLSCR